MWVISRDKELVFACAQFDTTRDHLKLVHSVNNLRRPKEAASDKSAGNRPALGDNRDFVLRGAFKWMSNPQL